jgi:hypothetical protein
MFSEFVLLVQTASKDSTLDLLVFGLRGDNVWQQSCMIAGAGL